MSLVKIGRFRTSLIRFVRMSWSGRMMLVVGVMSEFGYWSAGSLPVSKGSAGASGWGHASCSLIHGCGEPEHALKLLSFFVWACGALWRFRLFVAGWTRWSFRPSGMSQKALGVTTLAKRPSIVGCWFLRCLCS